MPETGQNRGGANLAPTPHNSQTALREWLTTE